MDEILEKEWAIPHGEMWNDLVRHRIIHMGSRSTSYLVEDHEGVLKTLTFFDHDKMTEYYKSKLYRKGLPQEELERKSQHWVFEQFDRIHGMVDRIEGLRHEHVAQTYQSGFDQKAEKLVVLSEYVSGLDLAEATKFLSPIQHISLFAQVLEGLAFIHSRQLLHLNVKPSRIRASMDTKIPLIKFTDFGYALLKGTYNGELFGTALYMAPEIALEQNALVDERADLYSFAATFYACLTQRFPFPMRAMVGSDRHRLKAIIQGEEPVAPPSHYRKHEPFPEKLDELLTTLLKPSPADRVFFSAPEILNFLDEHFPEVSRKMPEEISTMVSSD